MEYFYWKYINYVTAAPLASVFLFRFSRTFKNDRLEKEIRNDGIYTQYFETGLAAVSRIFSYAYRKVFRLW